MSLPLAAFRMRSLALSLFGALALLGIVAKPAFAGPAEDEARERTKAATAAFNLGHYEEAVVEYEAAYRTVPDPAFLYNIGQAQRLAGKNEKALVAYKSYLRTAPADAPNREQVKKHVEHLESLTWTPGPAPKPKTQLPPALDFSQGPRPADSPTLDVQSSPGASDPAPASRPIYKRWWFWTGVGAAVVAGTTTAILLGRGQQDPIGGNVNPPVVVVR